MTEHPAAAEHFDHCIDCHRAKYATPGMTAEEFAPYLPAHLRQEYWRKKLTEITAQDRAEGAVPDTGQAQADRLADGIRRFADDCKLLLDFGGLDNRVARSIAQQERNLRALLAEPSGDTVQAPAHPVGCPSCSGMLTDRDCDDRRPVRALLGTDTTPDRLAWISEAGETAAAERQARYQETACARRPAEETPDA